MPSELPDPLVIMDSDTKNGGSDSSAAKYSSLDDSVQTTPVAVGVQMAPPVMLVTAVAPADLPAGYRFTVIDDDNRAVVVEVPQGGVKHGERFSSHAIVDADDNDESPFSSDSTPVGDWRDGLFDCFQLGLCHPLVCLSWWCYPIALGQVLTRLKLDWFGSPTNDKVPREWSAFRVISLIWIAYAAFHYTVGVVTFPYSANGTKSDDPPLWSTVLMGADNGLSVAFSLYTLIVMVRARSYVRAKYSIPERDCAGCEDCCFSYFCHCCVVAQMARHINDYERYPADCCSETGLAAAAPELV